MQFALVSVLVVLAAVSASPVPAPSGFSIPIQKRSNLHFEDGVVNLDNLRLQTAQVRA